MKNISKWLVVLLFAATTSLTYTACNKKSVAAEKCAKECCVDGDKDHNKACCTSDKSAHADACKSGSDKRSCSHKKNSDAISTDSDSTSTEEAHRCGDNCHANGCTHKS